MGELAFPEPRTALRLANEALLPGARRGQPIELEIHTRNRDVSVRDMAAYLELLDHVYGRLQAEGYRSYAMRPSQHVRFEEIRSGSVLLTIPGVLENVSPLVILYLCLKYIPTSVEKLAVAYNNYEQGALARENRRRIRLEMEHDDILAELPRERRNELVALVEYLLELDGSLLIRAQRFATDVVVEVEIRVKE
jgi:hypothetical protein